MQTAQSTIPPTPLDAANYAAAELIRRNARRPRSALENPAVVAAVRREHFSAFPDGVVPVEFIDKLPTPDLFGIKGPLDVELSQASAARSRNVVTAWATFAVLALASCVLYQPMWQSSMVGARTNNVPAVALPFHLFLPPIVAFVVYKLSGDAYRQRFGSLDRFQQAIEYHRIHKSSRAREFWTGLSGTAFEYALASILRRRGLSVKVTVATGDGGIDIWINLPKVRVAVQCKRLGKPCGVSAVRDLEGARVMQGADIAVLASPSGFTSPAVMAARQLSISLWSLEEVLQIANDDRPLPIPLGS